MYLQEVPQSSAGVSPREQKAQVKLSGGDPSTKGSDVQGQKMDALTAEGRIYTSHLCSTLASNTLDDSTHMGKNDVQSPEPNADLSETPE